MPDGNDMKRDGRMGHLLRHGDEARSMTCDATNHQSSIKEPGNPLISKLKVAFVAFWIGCQNPKWILAARLKYSIYAFDSRSIPNAENTLLKLINDQKLGSVAFSRPKYLLEHASDASG